LCPKHGILVSRSWRTIAGNPSSISQTEFLKLCTFLYCNSPYACDASDSIYLPIKLVYFLKVSTVILHLFKASDVLYGFGSKGFNLKFSFSQVRKFCYGYLFRETYMCFRQCSETKICRISPNVKGIFVSNLCNENTHLKKQHVVKGFFSSFRIICG
jgi:hypothetical protein